MGIFCDGGHDDGGIGYSSSWMSLEIMFLYSLPRECIDIYVETSQELRMLSSVTINCQITKIVMNSGSQLSEL